MKRRALLSVSDKNGIVDFARQLVELGFELISTGGTFKAIEAAGIPVIGISDVTGFPECLDGRVKTLNPYVHAGILAMRSNPDHMKQLEELNVSTIDLVAVNLYPFKATIQKPGVEFAEAVENIDIGGPTMLRSAAKNYQDVYSVVDPADYAEIIEDIRTGANDINLKKRLMYKVYQHTAVYDTLISGYLREQLGIELPDQLTLAYEKAQELRYGENPHQSASFYRECFPTAGALTEAEQLHGKELSYNNINDANGALDLLREFGSQTAVVAVKHANPCGCAVAETVVEAYQKAYDSDPVSIFGGIVAVNGVVDEATAELMSKIFLEIIIAKDFTEGALNILTQKKNIRLLRLSTINAPVKAGSYDMKKVYGGLLVQGYNVGEVIDESKAVTEVAPTAAQLDDMVFGMKVVKHTKSNAIVLVKDGATVGIGAGQTNRIWAAQQAIEHAGERAKGAVLASDAFFPFSDCVDAAKEGGIGAIVQPGGSIRDQDSIDACNKYGIPMVFTGKRHFKH